MFIIELTLDHTYNTYMMSVRLEGSERFKLIKNTMVRRMFGAAMGEYLRDVKGPAASMDGRRSYTYVLTDEDVDNLAKLVYSELETLTQGK
jgi:hypothetical protein